LGQAGTKGREWEAAVNELRECERRNCLPLPLRVVRASPDRLVCNIRRDARSAPRAGMEFAVVTGVMLQWWYVNANGSRWITRGVYGWHAPTRTLVVFGQPSMRWEGPPAPFVRELWARGLWRARTPAQPAKTGLVPWRQ
jgi:hypothetical protein